MCLCGSGCQDDGSRGRRLSPTVRPCLANENACVEHVKTHCLERSLFDFQYFGAIGFVRSVLRRGGSLITEA